MWLNVFEIKKLGYNSNCKECRSQACPRLLGVYVKAGIAEARPIPLTSVLGDLWSRLRCSYFLFSFPLENNLKTVRLTEKMIIYFWSFSTLNSEMIPHLHLQEIEENHWRRFQYSVLGYPNLHKGTLLLLAYFFFLSKLENHFSFLILRKWKA